MALQRKYQGREQSDGKDESIYRETWYGTETEVDAYIATLVVGTEEQGKGFLHEWRKQQDDPHIWSVEVTYRYTKPNGSTHSEDEPDEPGTSSPKTYTLSCRNIQFPLESKDDYLMNWNHLLCVKLASGQSLPTVPAWWSTCTNPTQVPYADRLNFMWVNNIGEVPLEKTSDGKWWVVLCDRTMKPGIEVFDVACFVVVEKGYYRTSSDAGDSITKNINHVDTPPRTFGISGGEWKLDEGSVEHDGRRWVATRTWTHVTGTWDSRLYPHTDTDLGD